MFLGLLLPILLWADTRPSVSSELAPSDKALVDTVASLDKPLYSPFIERYVLDELKQLRTDMAAQKVELVQQVVDRELSAVDKAVSYATDTVTYFFYLIAAVSSMLVAVGWKSIHDIKKGVHAVADQEVRRITREYEQRLNAIERQVSKKTEYIEQHLEENREKIDLTQEIQSLWLRAGQDSSPNNKIAIYDHILKLRSDDSEALTYKADAVLELGEPQWAANLCHQALEADPENSHAFYQLACAYTAMDKLSDALFYLEEALKRADYRKDIVDDDMLAPLRHLPEFAALLEQ
jgi:tetratricopeptide (TPR) repeat protein